MTPCCSSLWMRSLTAAGESPTLRAISAWAVLASSWRIERICRSFASIAIKNPDKREVHLTIYGIWSQRANPGGRRFSPPWCHRGPATCGREEELCEPLRGPAGHTPSRPNAPDSPRERFSPSVHPARSCRVTLERRERVAFDQEAFDVRCEWGE